MHLDEDVEQIINEACQPCRHKLQSKKDFDALVQHVRESYVYKHEAEDIKTPLTDEIRKDMVSNVKIRAHQTLLYRDEGAQDERVLNLAKDSACKNASTARPARFLVRLCPLLKSVGCIVCGNVQGTCFLVKRNVVMTCLHVYMDINNERNTSENPTERKNIKVFFDYLDAGQAENVSVEVDEVQDLSYFSLELDYVFLRLKEDPSLAGRNELGSLVRNHAVHDGLVTIVGHPEGREKLEETCVVVRSEKWSKQLVERVEEVEKRRQEQDRHSGTNNLYTCKLSITSGKYNEKLPYDTSMFRGSSGSPVFDMNGHIIAMHAQGHPLEIDGKVYSVMEFGIHFDKICKDLRRRYGEDIVREHFPRYDETLQEPRFQGLAPEPELEPEPEPEPEPPAQESMDVEHLEELPAVSEPEEPLHEPRFQSFAEESELPVHVVQESMNDLTLAEPPTV